MWQVVSQPILIFIFSSEFQQKKSFLENERESGRSGFQAYWEVKRVVRGLILHSTVVPARQKENIYINIGWNNCSSTFG
jgi:hypothetical protein